MTQKKADILFLFSFISLSILQLLAIYYSPLDLAPDETHYWTWSRRLDLSYYSKGPLIAYLIVFGRSLFGDTEFGVRFPAFLCYSMFSVVFYSFARKLFLPLQALLGFLIIRTIIIFAQMGMLMTTDSPAGLLALLAIISWYLAVVEERKSYWLVFGFMVGLGGLAKYTILFLFPSAILFLLLTPKVRRHLFSREFLAGALLMLICLSPIIIWNAQHHWVNFSHNAGHILKKSEDNFTVYYFLELILGQLGLVSPVVFCAICLSFYKAIPLWKKGDLRVGVFLFSSFPLFIFVLLVSFSKRVYANWPLPVYIGAILLLLHLIYLGAFSEQRVKKLTKWAFVFSILITVLSHLPFMGISFGIPGKILPTKKLIGWKDLAKKVEEQLPLLGDNSFLLADDYGVASELTFYVKPTPDVYCATLDSRRMNQYDIWGGFEKLKEKNALIVTRHKEEIELLRGEFSSIEELKDSPALSIVYNGKQIREFYIYLGKNYSGRVFDLPVRR